MQDITIAGASYQDVPAVTLPKTGGGTARFTDVTPTTATDPDVTSGKIYFKSDGTQSTGTGSGGSAVIQSLSVTQNGTYTAPTGVDGYSPVTVNVSGGTTPVEPKEVNFIDFDGTVLHAYTVAEFQQLNAMPSNPSHTGLTAQGWNWSLTDAKTQLTAMPDAGLTIGQMYVTDDGKTRIYVHFEEGRCSPFLGICPKGTVTIDWGDGSATETLTGTSLTTIKYSSQHFYDPGDYVISLSVTGTDKFAFLGASNASYLLTKDKAATANVESVYSSAVWKVECGTGASFGSYSFVRCFGLKYITFPSTFEWASKACYEGFRYCYSLKAVVFPKDLTIISNNAFSNAFNSCSSIEYISLSKGLTDFAGGSAFNSCKSLKRITFPSTTVNVGQSCVANCDSLQSFVFPPNALMSNYALQQCYSVRKVKLSSAETQVGQYTLYRLYALSSITIPSTVVSFTGYALAQCYGLGEIRFEKTTAPTSSASTVFSGVPTDCLLLVPYAGLASYLNASNYPSSATYTYLGYATYASAATLPTKDSTEAYNVVWYATKDDAKAGTNAISTGNGSEIYCTYTAV